MSDTLTREYNLLALTSAGAPLPSQTLRFASNNVMRSITIDNSSNCDCGLYINRDPGGSASFVVPAGTYKTQPIFANILGLAFAPPAGDQPRGSAYVTATDSPLSASSGVSASSSATAVWDSSLWDSGAKLGS